MCIEIEAVIKSQLETSLVTLGNKQVWITPKMYLLVFLHWRISFPRYCVYKIVVEEVGAVWHWECQRNGPLIPNWHLNYQLHNTNPGLTESNHKRPPCHFKHARANLKTSKLRLDWSLSEFFWISHHLQIFPVPLFSCSSILKEC